METEKKAKRGKRGQGCFYLPKGSRNYWIKFSVNGRVYQETADTESKNEAKDFLRRRIAEQCSGKAVDCKKVTVQILKDDMTKAWELAQKNRRRGASLKNFTSPACQSRRDGRGLSRKSSTAIWPRSAKKPT